MSFSPPSIRVLLGLLILGATSISTANAAGQGSDRLSIGGDIRARNIVVYHPEVAAPTYIDNGLPGDSPGDVRIFHFDGTTEDGETVVTDWIMTTTGIDTAEVGAESRVTTAIFSFRDSDLDQVVIEGVGLYPVSGDVFVPDSLLTRAIIGGTGRFMGASGQVVSEHLEDGSWMHVFKFSNSRDRAYRHHRRASKVRP